MSSWSLQCARNKVTPYSWLRNRYVPYRTGHHNSDRRDKALFFVICRNLITCRNMFLCFHRTGHLRCSVVGYQWYHTLTTTPLLSANAVGRYKMCGRWFNDFPMYMTLCTNHSYWVGIWNLTAAYILQSFDSDRIQTENNLFLLPALTTPLSKSNYNRIYDL